MQHMRQFVNLVVAVLVVVIMSMMMTVVAVNNGGLTHLEVPILGHATVHITQDYCTHDEM